MTIISFINIGVLVLLVNLGIEKELNVPILQGKYKEFSVEWYRLVGASLIVQMSLMIVTSQASTIAFEFLGCVKRARDRCKKIVPGEPHHDDRTCCCGCYSTRYRNTR